MSIKSKRRKTFHGIMRQQYLIYLISGADWAGLCIYYLGIFIIGYIMEVVKDKKTACLLWYLVQIMEKLLDKSIRLIEDYNIIYFDK